MHPSVVAAVFPVIFIGELPDKTMFATVVMASRGHPRAVWLGAAGAFFVHVVIAATVGVGLVHLLPHRSVEALVAALFAAGAVLVLREDDTEELELVEREVRSHRRVAATAFAVIFVAEWGDLTQILIANMAAHYHAVGILRVMPATVMHRISGALLALLAVLAATSALRG